MNPPDFRKHITHRIRQIARYGEGDDRKESISYVHVVAIPKTNASRVLFGEELDKAQLLRRQLKEDEEVASMKERFPCRGVVILYGAEAEDLVQDRIDQCIMFLQGIKDPKCWPPRAIVFCPPPHPAKERHLPVTIPGMQRLHSDRPQEIKAFIEELRQFGS